MKKIILLLSAILFTAVIVQAQGIQFEKGSWKQILKKAKQEKKIIFVDVYTSWCGPCIEIASTVFTQEKLGKFHNEHFINYKIDAEKGEGPDFAKKYGVQAYPTFFYINGDGNIIFKIIGGQTADEFLEKGKQMPLLARNGEYDKVYMAIQEGKAGPKMFCPFYEATSKTERDDLLNVYLKAISLDKFFQEDYCALIKNIYCYDTELMNKLADMIVRQHKDAHPTNSVADSLALSSLALSFERKVSEMLERSIQQDDSILCNQILSLKEIYKEMASRRSIKDKVRFTPEQFMFVSPDYIRFCYGAENCTEQQFFKEKFVPYMNTLIEQNPTNRKDMMNFIGSSILFSKIVQHSGQYSKTTSLNILKWVAYYQDLMTLSKEQINLCVSYVKYAYDWQFYDKEIALQAADLLIKLGAKEECVSLLEDRIALYQKQRATPDKMKRKMELKLQAVKAGEI